MALGFYFTPSSFAPDTYDEVIKQLEAAGAGAPEGRSFHVALRAGSPRLLEVAERPALLRGIDTQSADIRRTGAASHRPSSGCMA